VSTHLAGNGRTQDPPLQNDTNNLGSKIVKQIILPQLEKEVNCGQNFANLRQIFNSIILSSWYKRNLKQALLNQVYANQSKVKGIERVPTSKAGKQSLQDFSPEEIYQQYLKAYKKGVFNYIKEDVNTAGVSIPRKYFSGGVSPAMAFTPVVKRSLARLAQTAASFIGLFVLSTNLSLTNSPANAAMAVGFYEPNQWITAEYPDQKITVHYLFSTNDGHTHVKIESPIVTKHIIVKYSKQGQFIPSWDILEEYRGPNSVLEDDHDADVKFEKPVRVWRNVNKLRIAVSPRNGNSNQYPSYSVEFWPIGGVVKLSTLIHRPEQSAQAVANLIATHLRRSWSSLRRNDVQLVTDEVRKRIMKLDLPPSAAMTSQQAIDRAALATEYPRITLTPADKAALVKPENKRAPGGIDLSTSKGMRWKDSKEGNGVVMNVDAAMIARFRREGIDRLRPYIFKITPLTSIWPLVGLLAPPQAEGPPL
jgi:hypothetical protein